MANRPLVQRLLSYQPYLETYHGYLQELLDGPFSPEVMETRIDELANLIRPYVAADELKFFTTAEFETALTGNLNRVQTGARFSQSHTSPRSPGLKTFVKVRGASVRQQLAGEIPSRSVDGSGNGATGGMCGGGIITNRQPASQ